MKDLIDRQALLAEYDRIHVGEPGRARKMIEDAPSAQLEPCGEMVSREVVVKFFDDWMSALDINCHHQSVADLRIIKGDIKNLPSAQPEQYTKEELKTFLHALSLRLLSLRSAQHWREDEKTAKEIEFLAHLYEKVEADMKGKA